MRVVNARYMIWQVSARTRGDGAQHPAGNRPCRQVQLIKLAAGWPCEVFVWADERGLRLYPDASCEPNMPAPLAVIASTGWIITAEWPTQKEAARRAWTWEGR